MGQAGISLQDLHSFFRRALIHNGGIVVDQALQGQNPIFDFFRLEQLQGIQFASFKDQLILAVHFGQNGHQCCHVPFQREIVIARLFCIQWG